MGRHFLIALVVATTPISVDAFAFDNDRENRVVCRRDKHANLGSHIRATRTCRTRAEWRELEEHTQNELQQIRDGQEPRPNEGGGVGAGPP